MINPLDIPITAFPLEALGLERMNAKDVCRRLFTVATDILTKEGNLAPVVFLLTNDTCFAISAMNFMQNGRTKDMLSFLLRKTAGETSIIGIGLVMEAWLREATETEKHTGMKDDNRPVSDHPNKKEAIVVQCEWYDGSQYMLTAEFNREKEASGIEAIKIYAANDSQSFEGRFANIFPPTRSGGFVH